MAEQVIQVVASFRGPEVEGLADRVGQLVLENGGGLASLDGSPSGRKLHLHAQFNPLGGDDCCRTIKDFLGGAHNRQCGAAVMAADRVAEGADQEVAGSNALVRCRQGLGRQSHLGRIRCDAQGRGRSIGVRLDPIQVDLEATKIPHPNGALVGAVRRSVDLAKKG